MNLSQEQWKEQANNDPDGVVFDVRTFDECQEGVIAGAICSDIMDESAFMARVNNLEKSKHYYVYCRSGARSGKACQIMTQQGFSCYNLQGGIMGWTGETVIP